MNALHPAWELTAISLAAKHDSVSEMMRGDERKYGGERDKERKKEGGEEQERKRRREGKEKKRRGAGKEKKRRREGKEEEESRRGRGKRKGTREANKQQVTFPFLAQVEMLRWLVKEKRANVDRALFEAAAKGYEEEQSKARKRREDKQNF